MAIAELSPELRGVLAHYGQLAEGIHHQGQLFELSRRIAEDEWKRDTEGSSPPPQLSPFGVIYHGVELGFMQLFGRLPTTVEESAIHDRSLALTPNEYKPESFQIR